MKRIGILGLICGASAIVYACGGTTTNIDGGVDSGSDGTIGNDSGGSDSGNDSGTGNDTGGGDSGCGGCVNFLTTSCDAGCPANSICVKSTASVQNKDLGCYPLPSCGCSGKTDCECVGACACGKELCQNTNGGVMCQGPISRREFKTDIDYVDDAERAALAEQALSTRLTEYRYKTEPEGAKRHLGFIIDDMPNASPAVASDKTHVDLYGYTSMLLATVQEQQKQIDDLKKQVDSLKQR